MSINFLRIAAYETQFATSAECKKAAEIFYAAPEPTTTNVQRVVVKGTAQNPLIVSIKVRPAQGAYYEARFSVNAHTALPGKKIPYHEIQGKDDDQDDDGNRTVLDGAEGELGAIKGVRIQTKPRTDEDQTNGKKACRMLVYADHDIGSLVAVGEKSGNNEWTAVRGDVGVIINPPYPP